MSTMSNNIFAALQKKKSSKKHSSKEDAAMEPKEDKHAEIEKAIFAAPAGGVSNWADDDEEEWDGHVPATAGRGNEEGWNQTKPGGRSSQLRLAEGQDEENGETVDDSDADIDEDLHLDIEAELGIELPPSDDERNDDEVEDEEEGSEGGASDMGSDSAAARPSSGPSAARMATQLSKKQREELKRRELEDLDAMLAEFGLESKGSSEHASGGGASSKTSSKAAKRKAKKEKHQESGSVNASPDQSEGLGIENTNGGNGEVSGPAMDADAIKAAKIAIAKKKAAASKKSAAAAAAAAAAAEAKKAKKAAGKDKSKFNEMPTR